MLLQADERERLLLLLLQAGRVTQKGPGKMTWGHPFCRCPMLGLALVESLSIYLSLELNPAIHQHVSSRKVSLGLKALPKPLWRVASLIPELLESVAIGIN